MPILIFRAWDTCHKPSGNFVKIGQKGQRMNEINFFVLGIFSWRSNRKKDSFLQDKVSKWGLLVDRRTEV